MLIIHPGETLQEAIDDRGITSEELTQITGVSKHEIDSIIDGEAPITTFIAERLEHVLAIPAKFWNNLQSNYEREVKRAEEAINYGG